MLCGSVPHARWTAVPVGQGWPANGAVKLEGVKMRYRPGLDLVLKGVSLDIKVCFILSAVCVLCVGAVFDACPLACKQRAEKVVFRGCVLCARAEGFQFHVPLF